jgi:hypothetical protein
MRKRVSEIDNPGVRFPPPFLYLPAMFGGIAMQSLLVQRLAHWAFMAQSLPRVPGFSRDPRHPRSQSAEDTIGTHFPGCGRAKRAVPRIMVAGR